MNQQVIESKLFKIYLGDSSLSPAMKRKTKKFASSLSQSMKVFETFLFSSKGLSLSSRGLRFAELELTLCGPMRIKTINYNYRNKNKVTDVISLQQHDDLRIETKERLLPHLQLGQLFICREKAMRQAKDFQVGYNDELLHLFVHGFLHLLGFDHEVSDEEELIMQSEESKLVNKIGLALGKKNG